MRLAMRYFSQISKRARVFPGPQSLLPFTYG